VPVTPAHAERLVELFDRAGVACHCRYWHFAGSTNSWLERSTHAPELNRVEMTEALVTGSPEMHGIVALAESRAVGWLKLAPAQFMLKLYDQRIYRRLPCFDSPREGVLTVGCFLVDPAMRRCGVAALMLDAAIEHAEANGATAIEAFPRRAEGTRDEEVWTGPFALFQRRGFMVVNDFAPYPVLRLPLRRPPAQ
jgi:GNAT superfamily N-acetyltransferase